MRIQKFDSFIESISEGKINSSDYYKGNTVFSRWLRNLEANLEYDFDRIKTEATPVKSGGDGGAAEHARIMAVIPAIGKLIASSGAAIADFFFKGDSKDSYSKMSKSDLLSRKTKVLDDWEKEKIGTKEVDDKDAENFYKSGVLKGKKYFGKDFTPSTPKNDDEKMYSEYLSGAMERYYNKIKRK